ncbi:MAG TPA: outer membrane lipid asymmetry maintenance protein MlaD [Thermopetrobacter sp.]|nr:outer membrane lipid asymmetry maintenance protein MlaD [Thermopetrobacter sp.]
MNSTLVETITGAVVLAVAGLFFWYVASTTNLGAATGGYHITAVFDSVDGIAVGSDVRVAGHKVGGVTDVRLDTNTYQAVVTLAIRKGLKLPVDTSAKITASGLLGDRYITLDPGGAEQMLQDGDSLTHTQSSVDLWGMINQYLFSNKNK